MKNRKWMLPSLLMVLALVASACGDDDDPVAGGDDDTTTTTEALPEFPAGSTMAKIQEKGTIVVGTKFNQLGSGLKNPATQELEGFDIEIAKLIAAGIFGGTAEEAEEKIEFKDTQSGVREAAIQTGDVDMIVATYTINDARKQLVDFAGPYVIDGQTVMVKSDNNTIKALTDLNGKKVCSGRGSTTPANLTAKSIKPSELVLRDAYAECADELRQNRVEAVITDRGILLGLVEQSQRAFKLLDIAVSEEPLGIGLKKGDDAFRDFLNDRVEEIYESGEWAKAHKATLGELGLTTPQPPAVDRYPTTGTSTIKATTTVPPSTTTTTTGAGSTTTTTRAAATTSTS